ncbi:nitrous oxide reductase accessory protein NosL [Gilvimarinus agarilyticus]|uniref:nitrous oxide reductase accessory protein NosL n=1 Tax=Gilvimarinus sp. 2_MG-2023 TaxID=3062666 RepID=UPI001C085E35|nr:nitrous oxide reductase accessory protein NosL [Gilvimarinus sp. 2_MG-2023]MBU2886263.1 nitrous oxide reductase accessory protein NosL [Gilvimarinus agarilyticus]MDO6570951.1 nitrous oxide reductase accessory protein NosL [Gilvimarinus sp. 2_MG-2023]
MHIPSQLSDTSASIIDSVLRDAKKLHRTAQSKSYSSSLPILRRLLHQEVFRGLSLPALRSQSHLIQRKHILQLLALEANYTSWAQYRQAIINQPDQIHGFEQTSFAQLGYPNHWFSSLTEAQAFAKQHGGQVFAYANQGVVVPS